MSKNHDISRPRCADNAAQPSLREIILQTVKFKELRTLNSKD